jgi:hypothetical protein
MVSVRMLGSRRPKSPVVQAWATIISSPANDRLPSRLRDTDRRALISFGFLHRR